MSMSSSETKHLLTFIKFLIYTTIGSIPWTLAFVYVGYSLGDNWIILSNYINKLKTPIRIILIILIVLFIYKKIKNKYNKKK
jgi:membrane protein DedA with SNARE-associated domain